VEAIVTYTHKPNKENKMDKKTAEKLASALSQIGCIPSFNGALLLSDDVADVVGFQIHCEMNDVGRTVFKVQGHTEGDMTYSESLDVFKSKFQEIHGNPVRELGKHDINTPNYPSMGSDYAEDVSPATIIRIMRVSFNEDSNGLNGILPAYIMRLTREVNKWSGYFSSLANKTKKIETQLSEVLEESF
jgi:hypothetical protein